MKVENTSLPTATSVISASISSPAEGTRPGPALAIIVPVFNERDNLASLVKGIDTALGAIDYEIVFVDDQSTDGTSEELLQLTRTNKRVRRIRRIGRRGLTSACFEGILSTSTEYVAVMDGDLQHDPGLLPHMYELLCADQADLVVGSRYAESGSFGNLPKHRLLASRLATRIAERFLIVELADPMSGFFMARRDIAEAAAARSSGVGFKILFEIIKANAPNALRVREMGYRFGRREHGESKLDARSMHDFLLTILHHSVGQWLPARFVMFAMVGGLGVFVHFAVLTVALPVAGFTAAQAAASVVAMTFNFALNNELTFRDLKLRGLGWLRGWLSFCLVCSVGILANVGVAAALFADDVAWYLSAIAGILVGSVWNFAVTSAYTWRDH